VRSSTTSTGTDNFWRVLQREDTFVAFQRRVEAHAVLADRVGKRRRHGSTQLVTGMSKLPLRSLFAVARAGQAVSRTSPPSPKSYAAKDERAGIRVVDLRRGPARCLGPAAASGHLNQPALDVIRQEDGPKTLFYLTRRTCTRRATSPDAYQHEMTKAEHRELLTVIRQCTGKVMLSGYPNPLYDNELAGWRSRDFSIDNKAAGGKAKRKMTEALWMNF